MILTNFNDEEDGDYYENDDDFDATAADDDDNDNDCHLAFLSTTKGLGLFKPHLQNSNFIRVKRS